MNKLNPFENSIDLQFTKSPLREVLRNAVGFSVSTLKREKESFMGLEVNEGTDDPFFILNDVKTYYQRGLVWPESAKISLIDSIYNNIDIGKFVIIRRSPEYIMKLNKEGIEDLSFHEILDGKQRVNAIISFILGEFKDSYGNYFHDYDDSIQRKFNMYANLAVSMIEDPTPKDIKRIFLTVNYSGVPMSAEHIDYIKSINV